MDEQTGPATDDGTDTDGDADLAGDAGQRAEVGAVELPQRFYGGFRLGLAVGAATLVVDEGGLHLFPEGTAQAAGIAPLHHSRPRVTVFTPRWQPPTSNTGVLVEAPGGAAGARIALADLPGWQRTRLRAALAGARIEVDERRTAFDIGRSEVRPSASPWPRWLERLWTDGDVPARR